jgi:hypothetical protein
MKGGMRIRKFSKKAIDEWEEMVARTKLCIPTTEPSEITILAVEVNWINTQRKRVGHEGEKTEVRSNR